MQQQAAQQPQAGKGSKNDVRPMTGDEYLERLRDGREIWLYGERVKDVTTHPAFRNTRPHDRPPLRCPARPGARRTC